jgi:hypothetical protein
MGSSQRPEPSKPVDEFFASEKSAAAAGRSGKQKTPATRLMFHDPRVVLALLVCCAAVAWLGPVL